MDFTTYYGTVFLILVLVIKTTCYEKTLRKIVRNQSKMVQTSFSERRQNMKLTSSSHRDNMAMRDMLAFPNVVQGQANMQHKMQRPRYSTIFSTVDKSKFKPQGVKPTKHKNVIKNELRLTRNITFNHNNNNNINNSQSFVKPVMQQEINLRVGNSISNNDSYPVDKIKINSYYTLPTNLIFFPPHEDQSSANDKLSSNENTIIYPDDSGRKNNTGIFVKAARFTPYLSNTELNVESTRLNSLPEAPMAESDYKIDFLVREPRPPDASYKYDVNNSQPHCELPKITKTDINAQVNFAAFNIEPSWASKRQYWNHMYEGRYESLMRDAKWPPLKVILIPRVHVDSIWKKGFESYHNDTVRNILSNIVKKIQFYPNLTFTWNEVSHLSQWWTGTTSKNRLAFKKLVREGRIEITTGGWVEPDEATTHFFGLTHQLIEGHQWLKMHLNYMPSIAWLTNSVTHSPTMSYLLSCLGINELVLTNLHYSWEEFLAEYQYSDLMWLQAWDSGRLRTSPLNRALSKLGHDRYPNHGLLTHYLQFNSAGFRACGPQKHICLNEFNFAKSKKNLDIFSYNVKEKAEMLLEQYSKTGTLASHNVIMAPIGGPFHFEFQGEFDYQYNNYLKLADYINLNSNIYKATIEFGTPKDYFKSIITRQKSYPSIKGDFLNFADIHNGSPAYWAGFYTSRPVLKLLLRRVLHTLRTTEILYAFAESMNAFRNYNSTQLTGLLLKARQSVARLLDRNVVSGTVSAQILKYCHLRIISVVQDCWYIQEVAVSVMSAKRDSQIPYLHKYVYRDGELISVFKKVSPEDQIYMFNSLSHERTEMVEILVDNPHVRIVDPNNKLVVSQLNPVWKFDSYNYINISRQYFTVTFAAVVSPLSLALYRVKASRDPARSPAAVYCSACAPDAAPPFGAAFPFSLLPIETGDIQLESYKYRLIFDELTGFLKTVVEKRTQIEKNIIIDFGAFRSSDQNSGMFLFNTNVTKPLQDILKPYRTGRKSKLVIIVSGPVSTEITTIYGRLLQKTVKIYNLLNSPLSDTIVTESKIDYEASPKNRELELFMSIQTDITNGNPPVMYTDNNGFQYTARTLNMSRRIESNIYPITSMAYIQDRKQRFTLITEHAQGVTALQEGQLVVMLDRRVLFDDGRGTHEGLADTGQTTHKHYILLENFHDAISTAFPENKMQLPSFTALHLASSMDYMLDLYLIDKANSESCYFAVLPLVKNSFPCDVALVNFRMILRSSNLHHRYNNAALLIMHKQSFSCDTVQSAYCNVENYFTLDSIINNIKEVYLTNLAGTDEGTPIYSINENIFPPMELLTMRIHF